MIKPKIRVRAPFVFSFAGAYQIYSSALDESGIEYDSEQISITNGTLTVKSGMSWTAVSMGVHETLVFLGVSGLGELSDEFRYGLPLSTKASIVKNQLIRHRKVIGVSRRQVENIFVSDLRRAGFPGARLAGLLSRLAMPFDGWQSAG
ncbi:MAG: hypothetical protein VW867_07270 [Gammaproteobacteria bacterium]|jgi:hypothetical protein